MTEPTEESEFYFQSIGALTGQYFPSEDDLAVGTLMSELGIFPANLRPSVQNFIENCPWVLTRSVRYLCWLKQIDTEPYYLLTLMKCPKKYPDWVQGSGWFNLQGLIEEVRVKEIVLLVQRNYKSRPTEEQLANSRTYIRIYNCPKGLRKGQFWRIEVMLFEGKLNHLNSHRIADARETKKVLAQRKEMFLQRRRSPNLRLI